MKEVISAREAHRIAMTSGDVIFNATVSAINDIIVKACGAGMTRVRVEWNKLPDFIKPRLIKYYEDAGYKYDESNVSGDYLDWSEPDGLDSNALWVSWRDDK